MKKPFPYGTASIISLVLAPISTLLWNLSLFNFRYLGRILIYLPFIFAFVAFALGITALMKHKKKTVQRLLGLITIVLIGAALITPILIISTIFWKDAKPTHCVQEPLLVSFDGGHFAVNISSSVPLEITNITTNRCNVYGPRFPRNLTTEESYFTLFDKCRWDEGDVLNVNYVFAEEEHFLSCAQGRDDFSKSKKS